MEFCLNCGKPLKIKKEIATCDCGFTKKANPVQASEKIKKPEEKGKGVAEKSQGKDNKGFPHKCKKCSHNYADVIDLGVFYSDESSVYLFRCRKCRNTERDAYGCSNA